MKRIFFIIAVLSLLSQYSEGQSKILVLASGLTGCELKNENMSPMTYYGVGAHGFVGFIDGRPKGFHELTFYGGATFTSPFEGSSIINLYSFDFDYSYLRNAGELGSTGIKLFAGGAFNARIAIRQHLQYSNNNVDMDQAYSLAIAGMAKRPIKLKKRNLDVHWKMEIPFVSMSIVPGFIGRQPEGFILNDEDKDWLTPLRSCEILSFGHFFRVISDAALTWNFINGNALFLKYRWDFTQNTSGNYIADARHAFSLGLNINLK